MCDGIWRTSAIWLFASSSCPLLPPGKGGKSKGQTHVEVNSGNENTAAPIVTSHILVRRSPMAVALFLSSLVAVVFSLSRLAPPFPPSGVRGWTEGRQLFGPLQGPWSLSSARRVCLLAWPALQLAMGTHVIKTGPAGRIP